MVSLFLANSLYGAQAFVGCIGRDCVDLFSSIISFVYNVNVPGFVIGGKDWGSGAGEDCLDYLEVAFEKVQGTSSGF